MKSKYRDVFGRRLTSMDWQRMLAAEGERIWYRSGAMPPELWVARIPYHTGWAEAERIVQVEEGR